MHGLEAGLSSCSARSYRSAAHRPTDREPVLELELMGMRSQVLWQLVLKLSQASDITEQNVLGKRCEHAVTELTAELP